MDTLRMQAFQKNSEIISAFFTNRFYNEIYTIAKDMFSKSGGNSLTEVYANVLYTYLHDVEQAIPGKDSVLRDIIKSLHAYYCSFVGETSLVEFIGRIIAQIVPDEFFTTMSNREKDSILRNLTRQTALVVGKRTMKKDMLHFIIDDRSNQVGVSILRDLGITILNDFRASFISKLYVTRTDEKGANNRPSQVVAFELYNKVRNEFKRVLEESVQLETENNKLRTLIKQLEQQIKHLRTIISAAPVAPVTPMVPVQTPAAPMVPVQAPVPPVAPVAPIQAQVVPVASQLTTEVPAMSVQSNVSFDRGSNVSSDRGSNVSSDSGSNVSLDSGYEKKTATQIQSQLLAIPSDEIGDNFTSTSETKDELGLYQLSDDESDSHIDISQLAAAVAKKNEGKTK